MREHMKHGIRIGIACVLLGAMMASTGCAKKGSPGASSGSEGGESEGGESSAPVGAVHKSGGDKVAALMGPAGGTLTLSSGARVDIPAGALSEPQEMVLTLSQGTTAFFNSEHEKPVGPTFEVSPGVDAPEGKTITISIPLASYPEGWGDVSLGYEYPVGAVVGGEDSEHTKWQYENAKLVGGRATAELAGITGYRFQFVLTNLEAQ